VQRKSPVASSCPPSLCATQQPSLQAVTMRQTLSARLYYSTAKSNAQPLLPQMSTFHLNWDKAKKLGYCLIMHSKSARVENNGELIRSLKL